MKGFKGFAPGMVCLGKQYAENTTFEESEAVICKSGMHFCENPLDVLDYYPLLDDNAKPNEFAEVEALADVVTDDGKKFSTTKLHVGARLDLKGFIKASVDFMMEKASKSRKKDSSKLAASGYSSQLAASGDSSKLAASGDYSKLAASGYSSKLAASGYYSKLAASGDYSQLAASGDSSKLAANGRHSIAAGIGIKNIAKAARGSWIVLAEWKHDGSCWVPTAVKAAQVDGKTIKADTWYKLTDGEFMEV